MEVKKVKSNFSYLVGCFVGAIIYWLLEAAYDFLFSSNFRWYLSEGWLQYMGVLFSLVAGGLIVTLIIVKKNK